MILRAKNCNCFKCQKSILFEGVSPWFLSKTQNISSQFFFSEIMRERPFLIFWIDKNYFWNKKIEVFKSAKNRHFLRG